MLNDADYERARQSVFFGTLPEENARSLLANCAVLNLKAGDPVFQQGEPATTIYAVLDGLIKLSIHSRSGTDTVVEVFHPGSSFAEALAFRDEPYPVSASAILDARLVALPNRVARAELLSSPETFRAVLAATYVHLHKLIRQVEQLKTNTGVQRVAHFVLALAGEQTSTTTVEIPYEKHTLAALLGIKPETLSRVFRRLEAHGVTVQGSQVTISNPSVLRKMLEGEQIHGQPA